MEGGEDVQGLLASHHTTKVTLQIVSFEAVDRRGVIGGRSTDL